MLSNRREALVMPIREKNRKEKLEVRTWDRRGAEGGLPGKKSGSGYGMSRKLRR